ncbi:hypothetical protein CCAX7_23310 [Capsulimonas corticalis]|uniref:Uncharacterized protein n=1 Tax=Capsulimonas corticalis TaxID=2219043 RepID=A0A402CV61_9BACT|nr:hypothetical protein [Capsulimonas corticalis]BDI30280.1 hypothetical protein CCAX7_23310 [Capsulimonas corticalis]
MAGTVVGVFEDNKVAEAAAQALLDAGVPLNDISLVRKGGGGEVGAPTQDGNAPERNQEEYVSHAVREVPVHDVEQPIHAADEIAPRAAVGLVTGSALGALLVSLAVLVPGLGAIVAAGPLLAMMSGGVGGGVIGGLIGALTAGGIPEEAAKSYHEHVAAGDTLVTVLASNSNHEALENIIREHGGHELGFYTRFVDSIQSIES